jgi:hypothetical protein
VVAPLDGPVSFQRADQSPSTIEVERPKECGRYATVATVRPQGGYERPQQPEIPSDTTNVLFIYGGNFVGLEDINAKSLGRVGSGSTSCLKIAR